jgi:hypothetical protein
MEPSVSNIAIKRNKQKYGATSTVVMTTSKQWENTYETIKLQVLPNLLTPVSTRKKVPHSIFETRLLLVRVVIVCSGPNRFKSDSLYCGTIKQWVQNMVLERFQLFVSSSIDCDVITGEK